MKKGNEKKEAAGAWNSLTTIVSRLEGIKTDIRFRLEIEDVANEITSNLMKSGLSLSDKIRKSLMKILEFTNADKGSIMLRGTKHDDELTVVEALSGGGKNTDIIGLRQKISNSVSSWVTKNKELLLVNDIRNDDRFKTNDPSTIKVNYKSNSLLSIPFIDKYNSVVGVLNLTDKKDNVPFSHRDIESVVTFVQRITPTICYTRINEQLRNKNEELDSIHRRKVDLTNMVVHDIKGHLGEIVSNIDILRHSKELAPNYKECLAAATEGCDSLLRLVLNLLEVNKMEEGRLYLKYIEFDIVSTIEGTATKASGMAKLKNVQIQLVHTCVPCMVTADQHLLERVLDNLLINAINYSSENEAVTISASQDDCNTKVAIHNKGRKIASLLKEKIFDKYHQGKENTAKYSIGLGLTFCKMVIEEHNGTIFVDSEEEGGTTFIFSVPTAPKRS